MHAAKYCKISNEGWGQGNKSATTPVTQAAADTPVTQVVTKLDNKPKPVTKPVGKPKPTAKPNSEPKPLAVTTVGKKHKTKNN